MAPIKERHARAIRVGLTRGALDAQKFVELHILEEPANYRTLSRKRASVVFEGRRLKVPFRVFAAAWERGYENEYASVFLEMTDEEKVAFKYNLWKDYLDSEIPNLESDVYPVVEFKGFL